MSRWIVSVFVGGILPLRMALMKIPIWCVRWGVAICLGGCIAFNFLEGDCICMSDSGPFVHVTSSHDYATESLYVRFEEVMVEQ